MILRPRLLIVEDDEDIREDFFEVFSSPPPVLRDAHAIPAFEVDKAATGNDAAMLLHKAVAEMRPYDVVLLDLGLPQEDPSGLPPEDPKGKPKKRVGLNLLDSLIENKWSCEAVIVHTIHDDVPIIINVLKAGAADFVPKPCDSETIFRSVIEVFKKAQARLEGEWNVRRGRRAEWLLILSRAQTADQITQVVSDGISQVLWHARRLEGLIQDHYQVNAVREPNNALCRELQVLKEKAMETTHKCAEARTHLSPSPGETEEIVLQEVIDKAIENLRSGFAYRCLSMQRPVGCHAIWTFRTDVEMIIQEILFSAIEASEEGSQLRCTIDGSGPTMSVSVTDCADSLAAVSDQINRGEYLDERAGRGWGLSLTQWLANNIGARLEMRSTDSGNTVTLHLPVIPHDQPVDRR